MIKMTRFCTQWLLCTMLLLCPIPSTRAATYKVAAAYLSAAESTAAYSIYTTGLLAPAALQPNTAVSYSVSRTGVSRSSGYSVFSFFSTQSAVAMFGQAGMYLMFQVYSNAYINNVKLVSFAPLSQSVNNPTPPCFLTFLPQVYWTMASGQVEAVAMLMALANRDRFLKAQILLRVAEYVTGVGFSVSVLMPKVAPTLGASFGQVVTNVISQPWMNSLVSSKNGVYYLFPIGEFDPLGVFWMQALSINSNVRQLNATIAVAFELQYLMLDTYKSLAAAGNTMLPPENILSTAPVPGVDSTEYVASQTFVTEASSRFPTGVSKCLLNYMMAGWVGGWALMDALSMFSGSTYGNGQQFYSNMLGAQSSFVVADMFVGSFGGAACSASAKSQGCIPQCHHGGNNVFFFTFTKSGTTYDTRQIAGEYFQYALGMCANVIAPGDRNTPLMDYSLQLYLPNPIHAVGFSASDNSMIALVCNDYQDVITRLHNSTLYWHHSFHRFTGVCINTVSTAAPGAITTFQSTYVMNTLMGVLPDSVVATLSTSSRFVVDVFPQTTQPRLVHSNLIYLFPTLEQDLHVLASFLRESTPSSSKVCAVVGSSTVSSSIATLLSTTLKSVEIDVSTGAVVTGTSGSLTSSIPAGCDYAFLVGLATKDVALISTYLGAHSTTTILITFDDLTKYYSNFATTFTSANAVTDRLLFATNIPSWTATTYDSSAANAQVPLSTVGQFLQSVPPYLHTPAAVRAFLTAMVVDFISANPSPAYPTMSGALYGNGTVSVGDVVFGPFSQTCGSSKAATCVLNFGARDISVWSYTRVLLPETPLKFDPTTPNAFNVLGSGTQSNIVDGGQGAVEADADEPLDCVMLHDSSISSEHHSTSQHQGNSKSSKPAPTESHAPDRSLKDSTSSDQQNSSSDSNVLDSVLYCLVALVCVVAVLLLALWLYGQCGLCYCRRATTCIPRARITKARHWHEDAALRAQASTPLTSMQQLTAVVVDVDGFQALWNRAPVEMSQFMRNYHAVVRRAIIRHHCSEAGQIGGYYAVACESPSTALALAYEVESQIGSAITTELRAALPQDPRGLTEGVLPSPLRIGVHTMTNTSVNDPELFCIAHRTAYVARRGHTMATDAVCNSIETSPDALQLVPVGRHPVLETSNEEMLKIFEHSELEVPAPSKQTDSACWRSALMVERQRECQSMDVNTLCKNYLQSLNRGCSTNTLMVTLECLCQHFGLVVERAPSLPDEEYLSLLAEAVSQRLGAMMEYRHALSFNSSPAVPDSSESVGTVLEALAHSMPTTKDSALMTITRESRKSKRFHRSTTMALRVVHNSSVPQSRMSQGGFSTEDSAPVE